MPLVDQNHIMDFRVFSSYYDAMSPFIFPHGLTHIDGDKSGVIGKLVQSIGTVEYTDCITTEE